MQNLKKDCGRIPPRGFNNERFFLTGKPLPVVGEFQWINSKRFLLEEQFIFKKKGGLSRGS